MDKWTQLLQSEDPEDLLHTNEMSLFQNGQFGIFESWNHSDTPTNEISRYIYKSVLFSNEKVEQTPNKKRDKF